MRPQAGSATKGAFIGWLLLTYLFLPWMPIAARAEETGEQVQVADAYLELRTGPGRGYPVFYIAERGQRVTLLVRRTDWFKVRTANGKLGWVSREQMERTLTDAGVAKTFRDVLYEDYLRRRFEAGFAYGRMSGERLAGNDAALEGAMGYRINEHLSVELALSQVSDKFLSANFVYFSLVSEPYPTWTISPTLSLGLGKAKIEPKATLISAPSTNTDMANAGVGARFYFTRRFFLRVGYKVHRVFDDAGDRTDGYKELSTGIGFFF